MTSCQKALQIWQEKEGANPEEAETVKLLCLTPPITKMDGSLNNLVNCQKLSLSTNSIEKMIPLPGLKNLKILSLGRNQIKKIGGLDEVGATLEELWMSYNHISTLDGLHSCVKLKCLFMSNNKIKSFDELDKLRGNMELGNVLFMNNPMYDGLTRKQAQPQVLKRLPNLKTVDGEMAALDAMEADERMVEIKEVLCSKYGGSVEGALDALEIDISIPHDVNAFVAAMANLEISKEDAEHMFDCVDEEKSGAVTLEKLADYFENC